MIQKLFRFNDWSFSTKIAVSLLLVGILPVAITSFILATNAAQALEQQAFNQLQAVTQSHRNTMQLWIDSRRGDAISIADDLSVRLAVNALDEGLVELGDGNKEVGLQRVRDLYAGKPDIRSAEDNSEYSAAHQIYEAELRTVATAYAYADVFLISADGSVIYTATKEDDFGTNLVNGPYRDSNLADVYNRVLQTNDPTLTTFEDFEFYAPSDAPAAFFGAPIYDGNALIGVLVLQLSNEILTTITSERQGLGETGESYIVGPDKLFRNDSRFLEELGVDSTILNPDIVVDTVASNGALAGGSDVQLIDDYRGEPVLSAWVPLVVQEPVPGIDPDGTQWAFISEIDQDEVLQPVRTLQIVAVTSAVIAALAAAGVAFVLSRFLTRQVNEIDRLFRAVGIGDFDARASIFSLDELGRIADGVNSMLQRFIEMLADADQERTALQSSIDTLVAEVSELASGNLSIYAEAEAGAPTRPVADALNFAVGELRTLVSGVEQATNGVTGASANMSEVVTQMASQAANSATVADQAAQSAKEGSRVVDATISAMERIRENTQESSTRMKRLGEASQEISEVVRFIEEIADRTTVLALNASIQAAAAGDAGRGFAVVAEEVQRLAERSTAATRQIEKLVKGIQAETNEAVVGIEEATREVVDGSELARVAGIRMGELNALITELASLIQRVAQDTSRQTEDSVRILSSLSTDLENSVAAFRGSDQAKPATNGKHENGSRPRTLAYQS